MNIKLNRASAVEVFAALEQVANKGQNVYVEWQRDCKLRKSAEGVTVQKLVRAPVRYGVNYGNMASVKGAIAEGLRGEVESLPWGTWRTGYESRIIDHKETEYCRFAAGTFANMQHTASYTLNGTPATFEQVRPYLLASELPSGDTPLVFTVKARDITSVGAD